VWGGVEGRLEPGEAYRVAGVLIQALEKETDAYARHALAAVLMPLAGRLEPKDAARVWGQVFVVLTQALEKTTDTSTKAILAEQLADVAGRLEPAEAVRM